MINYIKSECYRIFHSKGFYIFTAILSFLALLINLTLALFGKYDTSFTYNITSFSYSQIVGMPMIFPIMAAFLASSLYDGSKKDSSLKNTVSFGINRTSILAGQFFVTILIGLLSMAIVMSTYILSAIILLQNEGTVTLNDLLTEILAVLPITIASLMSAIIFINIFEKKTNAEATWLAVWIIFPQVLYLLSAGLDVLRPLAMWLPQNFFSYSNMPVNMRICETAWQTTDQMMHCLQSGIYGIIFFWFFGMTYFKKKDL